MIETASPRRDRRRRRRRDWPLGAALFAVAFALRALPFPGVFTPERIEFFGFDAYYHMRRVLYAVASFPEILGFDPYLKFPHGARPIWTPVFDTALAWLALPFAALGGERAVEAMAVFVPPLLGAATVLGLWRLALLLTDRPTAFAAAALLSLLPAHSWYSQIGFVDHHALVALVSVGLVAAAVPLLRAEGTAPRTAAAVRLGACAAGALLVWPGMLAHLGLVEAALWLRLAVGTSAAGARSAALELAAAHATALLLVLPFCLGGAVEQFGPFSSVVLSGFQPWLMATLTVGAGAAAALCARPGLAAGPVRRTAALAAVGLALLALSAALVPELSSAVEDAWTWAAKDEAFQASVGESQPLFVSRGAWQTFIAELRFSRGVYLFPLALAAWLAAARRRGDRAVWLAVALWAGGLAVLTLVQRRFMNSFALPYALVMAWAGVGVARRLARRIPDGVAYRAAAAAVVVGVLVLTLAPVRAAYRRSAADALGWLRGVPRQVDRSKAHKLGVLQTGEWLRAHSPRTAGYLDVSEAPEYGILCLWGDGHVLRYTARRPVATDNFGDDLGGENMQASARYFAARDEEEALSVLDALRARYVVIQAGSSAAGPMFDRLYRDDGSGLAGHRLVFETPRSERAAGRPPHKVFERVTGATIAGAAPAGALVTATLPLRTPRGRATSYEAATVAGGDGRYRLHVAHATEAAHPEHVRATAPYLVRSGDAAGRVDVSEPAVREGRRVEGPALEGS